MRWLWGRLASASSVGSSCTAMKAPSGATSRVRELGHANVAQTSTYLQSTPVRLTEALKRLEATEFAHNSHTATKKAPTISRQTPLENRLTH